MERLGAALTSAGLARLPSRIFAALLVDDDGRMTAAEISEALGVSPAAVSGAVKYLDGVGMVRRERERGSRRDVFVVDDDAWHDTLLQADTIYSPMIAALERGIDDLGPDDPAHRRLTVSREFMRFILDELHGINERWTIRRRELDTSTREAPGSVRDMPALLDTTTRSLHRTALSKQRDGRVPGLYAAVCRGGELVWGDGHRASPTSRGERAPDGRRPVPGRLQHQDLHRGDGHAAARRGPARRSTTCSATTCPRCPTRSRSGSASPTSRGWRASRWATSGRPSSSPTPRSCAATSTTSSGSLRPHDHWHYSNVVYAMLGQLDRGARRPVVGGVAAHPAARARSRCGVRRSASTTGPT